MRKRDEASDEENMQRVGVTEDVSGRMRRKRIHTFVKY